MGQRIPGQGDDCPEGRCPGSRNAKPPRKRLRRAGRPPAEAVGPPDEDWSPPRRVAPKRKPKNTVRWMKDIQKLQASTHLLLSRMSVARVVQELTQHIAASMQNEAPEDVELMRFSQSALDVLHQAAEAFLVNFITEAYLCALHCDRVTLMPKDILLR